MRKFILVVAVAVAIAVGFSMSTLKARVARGTAEVANRLAERSGADVVLGDVGVRLFPRPSVEVGGLTVEMPGVGGAKPIVNARAVRVYPKLLPLLVGRARIHSLEAVEPVLLVERERDGSVVSFLPAGALEAFERSPFVVALSGGTLVAEDAGGTPVARLDVNEIAARIFPAADDGSLSIEASGELLGPGSRGTLQGRLRRGVGPTGGDWLSYRVSIEDGDADALRAALPPLADIEMSGALRIDAEGEGYLGERTTEIAPAEPLLGRLSGELMVGIAGRSEPAAFEVETAVDDKRIQLRDGTGRWGRVPFTVTGWVARRPSDKVGIRFDVENVDTVSILTDYGVPPRWQPKASIDAQIRLGGTSSYPLIRYEASMPSLEFAPWEALRTVAGPTKVRGSLLAVNADVSGSIDVTDMRVGAATIPKALLGGSYWRKKLTLSALDMPVFDGRAQVSMAYYPEQGDSIEGGGMLENVDADVLFGNVVPQLGLEVGGRADVMVQVGVDGRGPWALGRVGVYEGRLGPRGLGYAVLEGVLAERGHGELLATLSESHPGALSRDHVRFDQMTFDFQTRDDGIAVRSVAMELDGAELRGEGLIDEDYQAAGWGTLILGPGPSADLARSVSEIRPLIAADGKLRIPVRLQSSSMLEPDERFTHALGRAARGEQVAPFVVMESDAPTFSELPTLEEQFGR